MELGQIRDTQTRSIFVDILLKVIYEYRMSRRGNMEHLLVIEEARNIAPARREEDPPSVGERMVVSELRKFGEAMVFVAQFPTQVASEVIKNSGVRIIHRVSWAEDLKLIGEALNLTRGAAGIRLEPGHWRGGGEPDTTTEPDTGSGRGRFGARGRQE